MQQEVPLDKGCLIESYAEVSTFIIRCYIGVIRSYMHSIYSNCVYYRYEQAAIELKSALKSSISPQTHLTTSSESIQLQTRPTQVLPAVIQFCAQQVTNCYTSLQTWKEASDWLNEFKDMKAENIAAVGEIEPITDADKYVFVITSDCSNNYNCQMFSLLTL